MSTCDIITLYISAIKALRALDPSMVVLDVACEPIRRYLRWAPRADPGAAQRHYAPHTPTPALRSGAWPSLGSGLSSSETPRVLLFLPRRIDSACLLETECVSYVSVCERESKRAREAGSRPATQCLRAASRAGPIHSCCLGHQWPGLGSV